MTKRTDTVTLVADESDARVFGDPFFAQIVRGVSHELSEAGVQLTLSMTQSEQEVSSLARYLASGHADGVLLISEHGGHRLAEKLVEAGIPVVIGGRPLDSGIEVPYVDNDNVDGGRQAAKLLRRLGRRRVATIAGPQDMSAGRDRLEGFRRGMGRDFRSGRVEFGDFTMGSGEEAATRLLAHDPDIDGVFVASDLMALGAISVIRKAGRRVPEDVAVVGFDDIEVARLAEPSLTTLRQHTEMQGRLMARVLLRELGHPQVGIIPDATASDGRGIIQIVDLVERAST